MLGLQYIHHSNIQYDKQQLGRGMEYQKYKLQQKLRLQQEYPVYEHHHMKHMLEQSAIHDQKKVQKVGALDGQ